MPNQYLNMINFGRSVGKQLLMINQSQDRVPKKTKDDKVYIYMTCVINYGLCIF